MLIKIYSADQVGRFKSRAILAVDSKETGTTIRFNEKDRCPEEKARAQESDRYQEGTSNSSCLSKGNEIDIYGSFQVTWYSYFLFFYIFLLFLGIQ